MRILFFAQLKDITRCEFLDMITPSPLDTQQLWAELLLRYPGLAAHRSSVRLARNHEYAAEETQFRNGDEVALIPPVSGG